MANKVAATFYAFNPDAKNGINLTVNISGGERAHDSEGKSYLKPYKKVKFNKGLLHTTDPEVIEVLRAKIARGANITEDQEVYLKNIMSFEEREKRQERKIKELSAERNRLKEQLEGKKKAQPDASQLS